MFDSLRALLLQVRNEDDPMRVNELQCFARALGIGVEQIVPIDLLTGAPTSQQLRAADIVLLGGSGHYSAAGEGEWLDRSLDVLRLLHANRQPAFASCWGFQAMARAMGGEVVNDLATAEVGTHDLNLTEAGQSDPVFGFLADQFPAQMGHEDHVSILPPTAVLLASSERNRHQAYRFDDAPIYCTQFHPELRREDLFSRVEAYPEYIERIARMPAAAFLETLRESPEAEALLPRFVETVLAQ